MSSNSRRKNLEVLATDIHIARCAYEQGIEHNTRLVLEYIKEVIASPASGIISVKWAQFWSYDSVNEDGPPIRDVQFYFNPKMFPENEEEERYQPWNGWVTAEVVKEFVESGMDVINLHELVKVEEAVDDVLAAIDVLRQLELGLIRNFGKRVVVVVRADRVEVERYENTPR